MAIDYAALKAEIDTDPNVYGYAVHVLTGNDQAVANLLNQVRDAIQIERADIGSGEIFHAIDIMDLVNNPGASVLEYFNVLMHMPHPVRLLNDDGSATPVKANVIALFKAGTATLTRLAALEKRAGSRAEELFGAKTRISSFDVATALRG